MGCSRPLQDLYVVSERDGSLQQRAMLPPMLPQSGSNQGCGFRECDWQSDPVVTASGADRGTIHVFEYMGIAGSTAPHQSRIAVPLDHLHPVPDGRPIEPGDGT